MNFIDLAKERYSVRNFDTKKIEQEKLDLILKAGQLAPTAVNYQPQRILVIESTEALEKLKTCTIYHFNAPMALLICADKMKPGNAVMTGKAILILMEVLLLHI